MEDIITAKEYILEHWKPLWTSESYRIKKVFTEHNATVFSVQCEMHAPTWTVSVARDGRFASEGSDTKIFIRSFLRKVGVHLGRDEIHLVRYGNRMKVFFNHETSECGKRITFARLLCLPHL